MGVVAAVALVVAVPAGSAAAPKTCPAAWASGWQKLANKIQAPVYCPTCRRNVPGETVVGGRMRCPVCTTVFVPGEPPPAAAQCPGTTTPPAASSVCDAT